MLFFNPTVQRLHSTRQNNNGTQEGTKIQKKSNWGRTSDAVIGFGLHLLKA